MTYLVAKISLFVTKLTFVVVEITYVALMTLSAVKVICSRSDNF